MKKYFSITLVLFYIICVGQTRKKTYAEKINSPSELIGVKTLEQAREIARKDIQQESIILYLETGIRKIPKPFSKSDRKFEEDYNTFYSPTGCLTPEDEYVMEYNYIIFDYFTEKYGKDWMKKIRKDTVGFASYNKKK